MSQRSNDADARAEPPERPLLHVKAPSDTHFHEYRTAP